MKNNPRFWLVGGLILVIMVGFAGWMLVVNPVYGAASQTRSEVDATERKTDAVMAQTRQLAQQAEDLEQQIEVLMRIRAKIPKDVNVPRLMRTIQAEARAENVDLNSLQPGQITLFKVAPSPTPTASESPSGESRSPRQRLRNPHPPTSDRVSPEEHRSRLCALDTIRARQLPGRPETHRPSRATTAGLPGDSAGHQPANRLRGRHVARVHDAGTGLRPQR